MLTQFLIKIVDHVVGRQGKEIVGLLYKKKDVNEFNIAKRLKLTINQARHMLYKLSDAGLISFIRKKDKKKGWYTYYWTLNLKNCLEYLRNILLKELENVRSQLKSRETKRFYVCKYCNIEMTEENALLHNFTCDECGEIYELDDPTKLIRDSKNKIDILEAEIGKIDIELVEINKVEAKRLDKEDKKAKAERSRVRKKARAKRMSEKAKTAVNKKPIKKKASKKKITKNKKRAVKKPNVAKKKKLVKKKVVNRSGFLSRFRRKK